MSPALRQPTSLEPACRELLARCARLERVAASYGVLRPEDAAELARWRRRLARGEGDHNLEFRDSLAWRVAERILFHHPGLARRLPSLREMLDLVAIDGLQRSRLDGRGPWPALYFLPTAEWVRATARLLRRLGVERPLEAGCGDGFVARCLREAGCPVVACDLAQGDFFIKGYGANVVRAEAVETARRMRADFVLWLWPPLDSPEPGRLIELPHLRFYCEAGSPGERSGNLEAYARYRHRRLSYLSRLAFSPQDRSEAGGLLLCNEQYLFFGRAHEKFARWRVEAGPEGPRRAGRLE